MSATTLFYFSGVSYKVDTTQVSAADLTSLQILSTSDAGRASFLEILGKYDNVYTTVDDNDLPKPTGGAFKGVPAELMLGDIESLIAYVRQLVYKTAAELRQTLLQQGFHELASALDRANTNYELEKTVAKKELNAGLANAAAQGVNAAFSLAGAFFGARDLAKAEKKAIQAEKELGAEGSKLENAQKNHDAVARGTHGGKFKGDDDLQTQVRTTETDLGKAKASEQRLRKQLRNIEKKVNAQRPSKEDLNGNEAKQAMAEHTQANRKLKRVEKDLRIARKARDEIHADLKKNEDALETARIGNQPTAKLATEREELEQELDGMNRHVLKQESKRAGLLTDAKGKLDAVPSGETPAELQADVAKLNKYLKEKQGKKDVVDEKIKAADDELKGLEWSRNTVAEKLDGVKNDPAKHKEIVDQKGEPLLAKQRAVKRDRDDLQKEGDDLQKEIDGLKNVIDRRKGLLKAAEARRDAHLRKDESEIDDMSAELNKVEAEMPKTKTAIADLNGRIAAKTAAKRQLDTERDQLKDELVTVDASIARTQKTLKGLDTSKRGPEIAELQKQTAAKSSIERRIAAKDHEIENAKVDIELDQNQLKDQQFTSDRLIRKQDSLTKGIGQKKNATQGDTALDEKSARLKSRIDTVEAKEKKLGGQLRQLEKDIDQGHADQKQALTKLEGEVKAAEASKKRAEQLKLDSRKHLEQAGITRTTWTAVGGLADAGIKAGAAELKYDADLDQAQLHFQQQQLENLYKNYDLLMEVAASVKDLRDSVLHWSSDLDSQVLQANQKAITA
jgi:hypothetical protein